MVLRKTAQRASVKFPKAAEIITDNSYMDDIVASVDTEEEAMKTIKEIDLSSMQVVSR